MRTIEIPELGGGREIVLSPEELEALRALGERIRVESLGDRRVRVSGAGYVGSVRLSDALTITITTKVPVGNLLRLASLAYRSAPPPEPVGESDLAEAAPLDWLAFLIVTEAERLLARSLRQGYVEAVDDLPYVRGRIRFDFLTSNWTRPGRLACELSDLQLDTPENRLVRATLETLATEALLPGLRLRCLELADRLRDVTFVPLGPRLVGTVRVTRLNKEYGPMLALCRTYAEARGVEEAGGADVRARAVLFPMEKVFEAAIANHLRQRLGSAVSPQQGSQLHPLAGEPAHPVTYVPDLRIELDGRRLVLDTKYANPELTTRYGTTSFRNRDLYQIAFYALAEGCPGYLVYPRVTRDIDVAFEIGGTRCGIVTVDLEAPDLEGLKIFDRVLDRILLEEGLGGPAP